MTDAPLLAGEPILLLVHGTGGGPDIDDEHAFTMMETFDDFDTTPGLYVEGDNPRLRWERGDRWWQTDGLLFARLSARLAGRNGTPLTDPGMVSRFLWRGENDEGKRNDAALRLVADFAALAGKGRRIHVLAHSHGGNVVRRAVEIQADKPSTLQAIRSITCFGTPFFRYTGRPGRIRLMVEALKLIGGGALIFSTRNVVSEGYRLWLIFPALFLLAVVGEQLGKALYEVFIETKRGANAGTDEIVWRNYVSARDEAISLLASFNDRIPLMRNAAVGRWAGMSFFHIVALVGILVVLSILSALIVAWVSPMIGLPAETSSGSELQGLEAAAVQLVAFAIALAATASAVAAYVAAKRLGLKLVDGLVTSRLRALAYGDDRGIISGVGTSPWPGHDDVATALPDDVEAAIEAHIEANTAGLWARLRGNLAPNRPLIAQNIGQIVLDTLTFDELAHTSYGRVESFVDMLARDLVATGDWRWREDAASPDGPLEPAN